MFLYGAGSHGKVVLEVLLECGYRFSGWFDDNPDIKELKEYSVQLPVPLNLDSHLVIVSIGDNLNRFKVANSHKYAYGSVFSKSSALSKFAFFGEGTVIMRNATVNCDVNVGKHVIINTSASVDHDCSIAGFVHISPNATLCGNVTVDEGAHIGAAAVLLPGIKVGKWAVVGAGAVVTRDVPDYAVVVGNPARVIRVNPVPGF